MNKVPGLKVIAIVIVIHLLFSCSNENPQNKSFQNNNLKIDYLEEWQNQKFSMFIHFGIYSIPAGMWNGDQINGYSEQIKGHAKIPTSEYRELASHFNPTKWNSDSIVILAKEAGMRSIVITAKHHDGFCLFDTQFSDFNIVDATPYKKDLIKDLSEACKRHGLRFGLYFSLIDWDYPDALPFTSTYNSDSIPPAHHTYNMNQVEELLTNYGTISELWFDMGGPTYEQSKELADLVKDIQPNCMVSGRIWNDQGDFIVMGDNYTPDFKIGVPWQTPASMFHETWSYRSWQERTDLEGKVEEKIDDLLNIVSSGGNYLLNIGPKADGSVVQYEKDVLKGVGKWLETNGEAIYNSNVSEIEKPEWGYITSKSGKLYLNVVDIPKNNKLLLENVLFQNPKTYPLANKDELLKCKKSNGNLEIELPTEFQPNEYATVIVVEYDGTLNYTPKQTIKLNALKEYQLDAENAVKYYSYSGHDYYSSKPTVVKMKWYVQSTEKESFQLQVSVPDVFSKDDVLHLKINEKQHVIPDEDDSILDVKLDKNELNVLEISLADKSNPHKGLNADSLQIILN